MTTTTVDRFLEAITAGAGIPADLLGTDAVLDATLPGWRFSLRGPDAIAEKYSSWFDAPGRFDELDRRRFDGGEVVTYLVASEEDGVPFAARHCHVFTLDASGAIVHDQFFCGGRWYPEQLAEMAAAAS